jgi:putative SOS response-associated peptidase YedK
MRTALGYVRVSTDEQAERGLGLEAQRQRIRAYCEMKGLHLTTIFEDPGLSGGKPLGSRSAGGRLLAEARRTKPVVVVAWQDRLFRSVADAAQTITNFDRYRLINARSDTVATKPSFRSAFKKRRCLIPADGFYEWKKLDKGKQPYFIHMRDDEPFAFAGIWEAWDNPDDGKEVQSCTIITTDANALMKTIHDRMPVILPASAYDRWLDSDPKLDTLQALLCPYKAQDLEAYPVSTYVNSPKNRGPKCLEPAA